MFTNTSVENLIMKTRIAVLAYNFLQATGAAFIIIKLITKLQLDEVKIDKLFQFSRDEIHFMFHLKFYSGVEWVQTQNIKRKDDARP